MDDVKTQELSSLEEQNCNGSNMSNSPEDGCVTEESGHETVDTSDAKSETFPAGSDSANGSSAEPGSEVISSTSDPEEPSSVAEKVSEVVTSDIPNSGCQGNNDTQVESKENVSVSHEVVSESLSQETDNVEVSTKAGETPCGTPGVNVPEKSDVSDESNDSKKTAEAEVDIHIKVPESTAPSDKLTENSVECPTSCQENSANSERQTPGTLPGVSPTTSLLSLSSDNSRQSSRAPTPLPSPSRTSSALVAANQQTDAQNAQMLADIQGDIQSVISQSFAMISNSEPLGSGSAGSSGVLSKGADSGDRVPDRSSEVCDLSPAVTHSNSVPCTPDVNVEFQSKVSEHSAKEACESSKVSSPLPTSDLDDSDQLLSELDAELEEKTFPATDTPSKELISVEGPNGMRKKVLLSDFAEYRQIQNDNAVLRKQQGECNAEISRLKASYQQQGTRLSIVQSERDDFRHKLDNLQGNNHTEDIYLAQIKTLEVTIARQEQDLKQTQEKLEAHDNAAKRAVSTLQNELKGQVDRVKKLYEECRREKEGMTMKYAQAEQKNIELQQRQARQDLAMKELVKERETVIVRFKGMKAEKMKMQEVFEGRASEVGALRREIEKQKEALQAADMKVKWHQNKLKGETEQHKETKLKIEDYQRKVKEAKEETEQIRRDCQAMVKTYQESDDIKSNSLGKELRQKEEKLQQHMQEKSDNLEVHETVKKELDTLKRKHKDTIEEFRTLKDRVTCLEAERITQEHTLDKFRETLQGQKRDNKEHLDRLVQLETVDKDLKKAQEENKVLEARVQDVEQVNHDLNIDMEGCAKRESEHLQFSQKVSDKNAQLQSENNSLNSKLIGVTAELERLQGVSSELEKTVKSLEATFFEQKTGLEAQVKTLSQALQTKSKAVEELSRQVEEEKDEIRTLKRKHTANIKDLTRQLHLTRKKLETLDQNRAPGDKDALSVGSRTSSNGSLDTAGNSGHPSGISRGSSLDHNPQEDIPPVVEVIEVDKQMLVEKIVRLQRAHARKNEKMEFMEDHINHLVTDIQRKTKIIQNYIMREESGALAPESMDKNKAQLARKGGIMASLYNSHAQDGAMNLDLSLEINHKLQSVLEDTLLKNITLKENLETLGEEIARISQENRRIQLQYQSQNAKGAS